MLDDELPAAVGLVFGDDFHCHDALTLSLSKGQRSRFDKLNVSAVDYCGGR